MVLLGFQTKLRINNATATIMAGHAGFSRWVFNWGLATRKRAYAEGLKPSIYQLKKLFTNHVKPYYPWMKQISSTVYKYAFDDLEKAYKNFFTGRGFPRFKKRNKADSFTIDNTGKPINLGGTRTKLPKIGCVQTYEPLPECATKKITISRHADGWYLSFTYEQNRQVPTKIYDSVGCDLGIKDLVVLSNEQVFPTNTLLKQLEKKVARLQYLNRHKTIGSSNWKKATKKIALCHQRIANYRSDYLHKITSYIAKNFARVVIEDLAVSNMLANHKLASSIARQGFYEFRRQLEYKCQLYGTELVKASRWYPSSKLCSRCKVKKQDLTLKDRIFTCSACGYILSRDLNAAINLNRYAVGDTVRSANCTSEDTSDVRSSEACGLMCADTVRLKQEINPSESKARQF